MNILIFRTNMRSANDVEKISALLDGEKRIRCWNVDREDIDCVLRIEAIGLECGEVIDWVRRVDLECAELEG